MPRISRLRR